MLAKPEEVPETTLPARKNALAATLTVYGGEARLSAKSKPAAVRARGCAAWGESHALTLHRADVSVLYIALADAAGGAVSAYFAVPIVALRSGFRACPLRDAAGKKIALCTLLARFQRRPLAS